MKDYMSWYEALENDILCTNVVTVVMWLINNIYISDLSGDLSVNFTDIMIVGRVQITHS